MFLQDMCARSSKYLRKREKIYIKFKYADLGLVIYSRVHSGIFYF